MTKRKFYKTTIQVTVLSEDFPYAFDGLIQLAHDIDYGDFVGDADVSDSIELSGRAAADELFAIGSQPEFFNIDADGNDVDIYLSDEDVAETEEKARKIIDGDI